MNRLAYSLARKRATEAAAVRYHGWGRSSTGYKLTPGEHWEESTDSQRKAAIELTEPIIEAFLAQMASEGFEIRPADSQRSAPSAGSDRQVTRRA